MDNSLLQVGSKIRIISKANVRYEGTFVQIDTEKLQIALCDVQFFGTETRAADYFIAEQSRVYPFVVFKSSDIKDIRIVEKEESSMPHDEYALEVSRMTSFSSSSGASSINGSFGSNGRPRRMPFMQDGQYAVPFGDQTSFGYADSHNNGRWSSPRSSTSSQYLWRIPRVIDYVGRSGDPKDLPLKTNGVFVPFAQDYDFEKYNKLFVDLCGGVSDMSLNSTENSTQELDLNESYQKNLALQSSGNNDDSLDVDVQDEHIKHVELIDKNKHKKNDTTMQTVENVAIIEATAATSKGATPKKVELYQHHHHQHSPKKNSNSTAYDKTKSFFDAISCNSIFRSPNTNPNWRERNTETFGIPMVCHQRRARRNNANNNHNGQKQKPKVNAFEQKPPQIHEALFNDEDVHNNNGQNGKRGSNNNQNNDIKGNVPHQVTIKKVHFKAVFLTQTSTPNNSEKHYKKTQTAKNDIIDENCDPNK